MTRSRLIAARTVDFLSHALGRRQLVRAARFVLYRARRDLPNDPARNGEYSLQRWLLHALPADATVTVLDVGANVGNWSRNFLRLSHHTGHLPRVQLHAFEPAPQAYRSLAANLPTWARVNRVAISDRSGQMALQMVGPRAGTNSFYAANEAPTRTELVQAITIDQYLQRQDIGQVDLLKVDAEGHDLAVLRGAERSLQAGAISIVQFEYNHRWVQARGYLKDAFDLLIPLGYQVGKLTPWGMEHYSGWDPALETFVEGNYLACSAAMADLLPRVTWWKHAER